MSIVFFLSIAFIFILCLLYNKHNALMWFGPASILAQDYMCIRYESPALSLLFALQSVTLFVFFLKKSAISLKQFPLKNAYLFLIGVYIAAIIVSSRPIIETVPFVISLMCNYLIAVVFFNEIRSYKDVEVSLISFVLVTSILSFYFLFEYITQSNPFLAWILPQIPESWGGRFFYFEEQNTRFSSVMCQSLMNISIGWGGYCSLGISLLLVCKKEFLRIINPMYYYILISILVLGVIGSGSRSALLYLVLIFGGFVIELNGKNKLNLVLLGILGISILHNQILETLESLAGNEVGGSSVEGRRMQLLAAISVISKSPIFGFGIKGTAIASKFNSGIMGSESIWLQQLINYGLLGVLFQIYMYRLMIKKISRNIKEKKMLIVFVLGWILFSSATTSPGFGEPYFLIIYVIVYKIYHLNKLQNV